MSLLHDGSITIPKPGDLGLVYDAWRPQQIEAIEWLLGGMGQIEEKRPSISVLEAPTGSGKTGIILGAAALTRQWSQEVAGQEKKPPRWLILCGTKIEQDQYMSGVLPWADVASVRGKNNYHCWEMSSGSASGPCDDPTCSHTHADMAPCSLGVIKASVCEANSPCPYYADLRFARRAQVVVTNYAYGLNMLNHAPGVLGNFDFIVCDEAHELDKQMESFVRLYLSKRQWARFAPIPLPSGLKSIPQWKQWAMDLLENDQPGSWWGPHLSVPKRGLTGRDLYERKAVQHLYETLGQMTTVDDEWVVDDDEKAVTFTPVWMREQSKGILFDLAERVIIMSGTIPDKIHYSKQIGVSHKEMEFKRLPYPFPIENRPVYVDPQVKLTRAVKQQNLPILVSRLDGWLDDTELRSVKGLVHTGTYEVMRYVVEHSRHRSRFIWHENADGRAEALRRFKRAEGTYVLLSPSMTQAVDLPGEECRFVVVVKIPYAYLGTKVMQKRAKDFMYYQGMALLLLRQMIGRGVRNDTDYCPIVVLDEGMPGFLKRVKRHLPDDVSQAIQIVEG